MRKIKILDENQEGNFNKCLKNERKKSDKYIKIKDSLFKIGLRKGLIEKYEDAYYLVGDYEKLLNFKINNTLYKISLKE